MPFPSHIVDKFKRGTVSPSRYATCDCISPKLATVPDFVTGGFKQMWLPCGHCVRCQDTRRNQMAARMFLHSYPDVGNSWQYCYYLTLTYARHDLTYFVEHPYKQYWLQTFPHKDSWNKNKRECYCPSILVRSHIVNYFKRLRKSVDCSISYVYCGEYGSKFGAPHFHAVVWTTKPVTSWEFKDAWAFKCQKSDDIRYIRPFRGFSDEFKSKYALRHNLDPKKIDWKTVPITAQSGCFNFRIGDVQVVDLWRNGSLDFDGKHPAADGSASDDMHDAQHNFSYVCKYLGKSYQGTLNKYAQFRIQYAFTCAPYDFEAMDKENMFPFSDTDFGVYYFEHKRGTDGKPLPPSTYGYSTKGLVPYEDAAGFTHTIPAELTDYKTIHLNGLTYEKINFLLFTKMVAPFFGSSRKYSIGKGYFLQNCERFAQKNFSLPTFRGRTITFPSYYSRLLSQQRNGWRFKKRTDSGLSPSKTCAPYLYEYFSRLRNDSNYWFYVRNYCKVPEGYPAIVARSHVLVRQRSFGSHVAGDLDDIVLINPAGQRIQYTYSPLDELFYGYRFTRKGNDLSLISGPNAIYAEYAVKNIGHYELCDVVPREDFCDLVLDALSRERKHYEENKNRMDEIFQAQTMVEACELTPYVRKQFVQLREDMQAKYDASHKNSFDV